MIKTRALQGCRFLHQYRSKAFPGKAGKRRGQSILEYSIVIFCIVAALLAMKTYITRGIQGRLKGAVDNLGEQYSPRDTASNMTLSVESDILTLTYVEDVKVKDKEGKEDTKAETTTLTLYGKDKQAYSGNETVDAPAPE